jgi:hypothetical protein
MAAIIRLEQTVELVHLMTSVGEEAVAELGGPEHEDWIRLEMMRFARDLALALAGIYARAAEWRGTVDARIEAHLFNLLTSGGPEDEILAAGAALNWNHGEAVTAVVGALRRTGDDVPPLVIRELRRKGLAGLVGLHGDRVIVLVADHALARPAAEAIASLCQGPVVIGTGAESLLDAGASIREAMAGSDASAMLAGCPPVVEAADLLPERALLGDALAHAALVGDIYDPLRRAGDHVIDTVSVYLETGRSLQRAASRLHLHPNTVRYRLDRAVDACGYEPKIPRDAFILSVALALGRRTAVAG